VKPELPEGFVSRAPRWKEIEDVASLIRECEEADEGDAEMTADDVRGSWERPRFDLERDAWLVMASDGHPAGYADLWDRVPGERFVADGYVRPEFRGQGVGRFLVRAAEARVRERAGQGRQTTLSHTIFHGSDAARLLLAEGYKPVQHYWRMVLEMDSQPTDARIPAGVAVRRFTPGKDDRAVWAVVQEAFSDNEEFVAKPFEEWAGFMTTRDSFDPSLYFVAEADGEIAGVALCPKFEDWGWVRQLAVRRARRRKGVARALMQTAFAEFYRRGYRKVGLVVDSYNRTGARQFYESLGMRLERQHDRFEKVLGS
jgi:mycothiol synthase